MIGRSAEAAREADCEQRYHVAKAIAGHGLPRGAGGGAGIIGGPMWIDSHCHLDAPEFDADRGAVVAAARAAGVRQMVLPAVEVAHFEALQRLAHTHGFGYALGIHPLYVDRAGDDDLERLRQALAAARDDPQLVAVGEIGLDHFVPHLDRDRQQHFYREQLKLARDAGLPVILHVRRSADALLAGLRRIEVTGGIAHAFNGSAVQARQFVERGFRLGFGGAMTYERALQIRELARTLPESALVLETDAPDIPPHWLYRTAAERPAGLASRNVPAELPRIAVTLAQLRGWTLADTARITSANVHAALPKLATWDTAHG
jgi:TatD DNase family protein